MEDIPVILAFNKQDLPQKFNPEKFLREINASKNKDINSRYTSALLGEGILECFEDILQLVLRRYYGRRLISVLN